ncbi:sugar transferase [Sporomusa aerivorans]|uniref:sugar transferase n=1 Tax=Sporomusa aerivorans TaxID=204936 RepID=UPI003529D9E3
MLIKRAFDLVFTVPGVIFLSPLFLLVIIWIKFDSPGPVFFRQVRIGQYGKPFKILKFRTMMVDAEKHGKQITIGADRRITKSGKILRKYKLDELPQLFNIIVGDMSLVGPRPEVPQYVQYYPETLRKIVLSVPPGMTDFASIEYKDENAILGNADNPEKAYIDEILPVKLNYCVKYVESRNVFLDFYLIVKTIYAIVK